MSAQNTFVDRRAFLATGVAAAGLTSLPGAAAQAADADESRIVTPPAGKKILLSCKLGMISKKSGDRELTLVERLKMAGEAGFDGVDFDEAGQFYRAAGA